MVTLRYSKLKTGKYSIYLDYFIKGRDGTNTRRKEYLRLYVSKDYSKNPRITKEDREMMELARQARSKREMEYFGGEIEDTGSVNQSIVNYICNQDKYNKNYGYIALSNKLASYNKTPNVLFSAINYHFLDGFFDFLEEEYERGTAVTYMGYLKTIMRKAHKEGIVQTNPFSVYKVPVSKGNDKTYFVMKELRKLEKTPFRGKKQVAQAFFFSCFTGLRLSDIEKLRWQDISTGTGKRGNNTGMLVIHPKKTDSTSGVLLRLPLSEQAIRILEQLKEINSKGRIFNKLPVRHTIRRNLKRWASDAGITKRLHFHSGRHTFATLCLTSGMDIYTVSKMLGHSTIEHTEAYAQLLDKKMVSEVKKFPEIMKEINI
jgi:integrase